MAGSNNPFYTTTRLRDAGVERRVSTRYSDEDHPTAFPVPPSEAGSADDGMPLLLRRVIEASGDSRATLDGAFDASRLSGVTFDQESPPDQPLPPLPSEWKEQQPPPAPSPTTPSRNGLASPPEQEHPSQPPEETECYCLLTCEVLDGASSGLYNCTLRLWSEVSGPPVRFPRLAGPPVHKSNSLVGHLDLRDSSVDVAWEVRTSSDLIHFSRLFRHSLRHKAGSASSRLSGVDRCNTRISFAIEPSLKLLERLDSGNLTPASATITAYLNGQPCESMDIDIELLDCDLGALGATALRLQGSSPDPQVFAWVQSTQVVSEAGDLGSDDEPAPEDAVIGLKLSFKATRSCVTINTAPDCCCEYYFRGFAWAVIDVFLLSGSEGAAQAARLAVSQLKDFVEGDEALIGALRGLMTDDKPTCYRSALCPTPEPEDVADFSAMFFLTQTDANRILAKEEETQAPAHQAACMAAALDAADNAQRQALSTNIHSKDRYDSYPFFCDLAYLRKEAPKSARGLGLSDVEALALSKAKDWQALLVIQTIADVKLDVVSRVVEGQECCCIFISSMTFTLRAGLFHCYEMSSSVEAAKQLLANVWQPALGLWKRADMRLADYVAPAVKLVGESQRCFTSQGECAQAVKDLSQLLSDRLSVTYATTDNGPLSLCYYNCTLAPVKPGSVPLTEAEVAECHRGCDDVEKGNVAFYFPDPLAWGLAPPLYPEAVDPKTGEVGSVAYQRGALGAHFLDEAERYNKDNPGWYLPPKLPSCPLTNPDKDGVKIGDGWGSEGATAWHPGAAECFRSDPSVFKYLTVLGPGQQCCYDTDGKLITEGPSAGTPDRANVSLGERPAFPWFGDYIPNWPLGVGRHVKQDVWPAASLAWQLYNKFWPPSTGK